MNRSIQFLVVFIILSGLFSCSDNNYTSPNPTSNLITFKAVLSGIREVPANASTATGDATLTFNNTTKTFTITVTHSIAAPTAGHIHKGAVGVNGSPVFPFTTLTSPISYTSIALTAAEEADLRAELYYVNIHSAAFPGGEIRGQLFKEGIGGGSY
ncbi:CHRD domain-containing protein [Flavobacterium sp. XS2P24]|uniref:CHRD domain-containing protein n=1 Tax=Flavobacterium sp. XS2P24 TaxID=3041249 RepID=UPI0024A8F340|nr:CHRD domain-containing protein [Flavobacterium sp. XS2P24]MDI6049998.1 CHRD domain-containing protein [Flavobacterium sp. XS2P24]